MAEVNDCEYLEVPMSRMGRRKSLSVGSGMDLLVTLKNNNWVNIFVYIILISMRPRKKIFFLLIHKSFKTI